MSYIAFIRGIIIAEFKWIVRINEKELYGINQSEYILINEGRGRAAIETGQAP